MTKTETLVSFQFTGQMWVERPVNPNNATLLVTAAVREALKDKVERLRVEELAIAGERTTITERTHPDLAGWSIRDDQTAGRCLWLGDRRVGIRGGSGTWYLHGVLGEASPSIVLVRAVAAEIEDCGTERVVVAG